MKRNNGMNNGRFRPDRHAYYEMLRHHHDPEGFEGDGDFGHRDSGRSGADHFGHSHDGSAHHGEGRDAGSDRSGHDGRRGDFSAAFGGGFVPPFAPGFGPGFGRGFRRGRGRAGRGDVRSAILSLLADGPSNGYGLIKRIGEKTHGTWTPSPGSVYPTLQQLVDEELIEATGDGRRTDYRLTEAGRAYVDENAESLNSAWEATSGRNGSQAAFHESVGKLIGVVQQVRMAGTEEQQKAAIEKLDELRRALYLILAD
jgi:DNA-binding PadR family transcriptional regulator